MGKQLPKTVIKTVLIQDGTNSILKEKQKNIDELFEKYTDLVDLTRNTLSPENILLMQVPPIRNLPKNEHINERIKLFNNKTNALAGDENYKVAIVYDLMKAMPSYDSLYYDDLHFHYKQGVPFLKNCVLSQLLPKSNNLIALNNNQRNPNQNPKYRNHWRQSYNYMRGQY